MVRAVTCRSSGGLVMSEEQCDQALRPLAIHPCGDRNCAAHWVEQEWQQVNNQPVEVAFLTGLWQCMSCLGSAQSTQIFKLFSVLLWVCQCNATCGRGVRWRQVVCAGLEDGVFKEFPDSSCDQINKPETSSSCFQRPCSKWFTTSWSQVTLPACMPTLLMHQPVHYHNDLQPRVATCIFFNVK